MIHIGETRCPSPDGQSAAEYLLGGEANEAQLKHIADSLDGHQVIVDTETAHLVVRPPLTEEELAMQQERGRPIVSLSPDASRLAMGLQLERQLPPAIELPPARPETQDLAA